MIKPEQVPDAAMNALLQALRLRKGGKEAIAAALSAWPGVTLHQKDINAQYSYFVLPLTEKPSE